MSGNDQDAGEKRVRELLVEPLLDRGLIRPSGMTIEAFEKMCTKLCQKLWYMSDLNLSATEEEVAKLPGGANADRFPIANIILEKAADIQPPTENNSNLIRAFFAHEKGRTAVEESYGPEILKWLLKNRRWPSDLTITKAREASSDHISRQKSIERRMADGQEISPDDEMFRGARMDRQRRCEALIAPLDAS